MAKTWTLDEIGKNKRVNGKTVALTDEEREQLLIDWNNAEKEQEAMLERENKKKQDAKSGNDKLLGLGLTQDEATALTGYNPPKEE